MKLLIQIPCYNEEEFLPVTLAGLPRQLEGVDSIEYLVIDDGSSDGTARVAREHGAHHVLVLSAHSGLARAFMAGLEQCCRLGADIIVNTDADNQYNSGDIQALIAPVLAGRAGMVIGTRPIQEIEHFSFTKKMLHRLGSGVVSGITGMDLPDAPSGFRALSRDAAMRLNIFSDYTYTLESVIQARFKNIPVDTVPVRVNAKLRESRLIKSNLSYIWKSVKTIFRLLLIYNPSWFFNRAGLTFFAAGTLLGVRYLFYYIEGGGRGHVQSLILLSVMFTLGAVSLVVATVAYLISVNRRLTEEIRYQLKKNEVQT